MNIELLSQILQLVHQMESQTPGGRQATLDDFRRYLNTQHLLSEDPSDLMDREKIETSALDNSIAKQVILLGRYTKHLLRRTMEKYPDLINEDFTYLYRLIHQGSLTKMQLIEKNAHEKQSGMEIIKRLVKNGLVSERPDENDRRSVRLSATDKGIKLLHESMKDITLASKILTGDLSNQEKENLLDYLQRLNIFHESVHTSMRELSLKEILEATHRQN